MPAKQFKHVGEVWPGDTCRCLQVGRAVTGAALIGFKACPPLSSGGHIAGEGQRVHIGPVWVGLGGVQGVAQGWNTFWGVAQVKTATCSTTCATESLVAQGFPPIGTGGARIWVQIASNKRIGY